MFSPVPLIVHSTFYARTLKKFYLYCFSSGRYYYVRIYNTNNAGKQ